MKPFRLSIFLLLLFYHATFVGVALNGDWTWVVNNTQTVIWITVTGAVLFVIIFLMGLADRRFYTRKIEKLEAEKDKIKAKVYDMQRRNEEIDDSLKSFEESLDKKDKDQNKS